MAESDSAEDLAPTLRQPVNGKAVSQPGAGESLQTRLSLPPQDLSAERLLLTIPRAMLGTLNVPALGGIPLLARLGGGGMARVYYGIHPRLRHEVAIKIMDVGGDDDPAAVERFYREARIAAELRSPHLVGVSDVNHEHGLFFIVMEYVSGLTAGQMLKQVMDKGAPGLDELSALDICIAATQGLAAAHAACIIHRDVKPSNILIPTDRNRNLLLSDAKLSDLGLARREKGENTLTADEAVMGTIGFMPPEQTKNAKKAGKPADVFAMGATLYTLLCGKPPFTGNSAMEVILATINSFPTPLHKYRSDISPLTLEAIEYCLQKDPAHRYKDAANLLPVLLNCRKEAANPTRSTGIIQRVQAPKLPPPSKEMLLDEEALRTFKYDVASPDLHRKFAPAALAQATIKMSAGQRKPQVQARQAKAKSSPAPIYGGIAAAIILIAAGYFAFKGGGTPELKVEKIAAQPTPPPLAPIEKQNTPTVSAVVQAEPPTKEPAITLPVSEPAKASNLLLDCGNGI